MGLVVVVLACVLVGRLVYLQVLSYQRYATLSRNNRISVIPIPPVRGLIFDRYGTVLAQNFPTYTLEITPDHVPSMHKLLAKLRKLIEITPTDLKRFRTLLHEQPGFESIPLRTRLTEEEAARVAVNRYDLQGAELKARLQRYYPLGPLMVDVVGYVGRISERDLKHIDTAAYRGTDYIGKLGIEKSYESELLGKAGYEQVETDAHGRVVRKLFRKPPVAGKNIYLNVDARIQAVAEKAMGDYNGAVVALDPRTGAVLAFVSVPTYNPNPFVNGIDEKSYARLRNSPNRPLLNRALVGRYAPGSTIKPFLGLASLYYGYSPTKTTFCPGWFSLPGSSHRYRCWRSSGHGYVDLHDAIVQSCDVYFYTLAVKLGINRIDDFLSMLGFGKDTGIDLDGEASGLVPSPAWKRRVRHAPWYTGETVITGIGQGYTLVTPLQLAHAVSVIANRGYGMQPHIVFALQDRASGKVVPIRPKVSVRMPAMDPNDYGLIVKAMTDVVQSPHGTARGIGYTAKYSIAGKTGTAQVVGVGQNEHYDEEKLPRRLRDHALFIAFAPVADPKIAVAVVVENGGHGGSHAAPVARAVMDQYLLRDGAGTPPPASPRPASANTANPVAGG